MERAELGVDGNAGFALLGENLQEGEAEFVTIETDAPVGSADWAQAASRAATTAYQTLRARVNRDISYYLGPSHPRHC